jgi:hypothetical protein
MPELSDVSKHYAHGDLTEVIRSGLTLQGKSMDTVTIDDLAPVDEFHIGGRRERPLAATPATDVRGHRGPQKYSGKDVANSHGRLPVFA